MNNAYAESRKRGILYQTMQRVRDVVVSLIAPAFIRYFRSSASNDMLAWFNLFNLFIFIHSQKKRNASSQSVTEPLNPEATTNSYNNAASRSNFVVGLQESPLIDFVLRRHPQETVVDRLKREYIRTSQDITVENLKMFLGKKLSYWPHSHFQVCNLLRRFVITSVVCGSQCWLWWCLRCFFFFNIHQIMTVSGGKAVILDDSISLALVRRDICDNPGYEIILHYRVFPRYW